MPLHLFGASPNELWRRQRAINATLRLPTDSSPAMLASLVGRLDADLCVADPNGTVGPSLLAQGIIEAAKERGAGLIVLDNLAHLFSGNENVRRDVAVFCSLLERMAIDADATVLILAHPSKAGAEYSGSTGWSAHVRQRWFLERGDQSDAALNPDGRILWKSKANYSASGTEVKFRWYEWAFTTDQLDAGPFGGIRESAQAGAENEAFLRCLDAATAARRAVSHNQGVNYAPNIFASMPEGKGFKVEAYKRAFERLLHLGLIELDQPVWKRENHNWKFGIKRADGPPTSTHRPTNPHQNPPSRSTDPTHRSPPTLAENGGKPSTDLHPPTPLYTTYISGAADTAPPDQSDDELAP